MVFYLGCRNNFVMLKELGDKKIISLQCKSDKKDLPLGKRCEFKELRCVLGMTCKPYEG